MKFTKTFRRWLFHFRMYRIRYKFFLTTAPNGSQYLSIIRFDRNGAAERRVFCVTDELPQTPSVPGSTTVQLFLPKT